MVIPKSTRKVYYTEEGIKKSSGGDADLVKLGNAYGFPRGFPILWKPGHFIDARGFYPKFQNDEEGDDDGSSSDEETVESDAIDTSMFDGAKSFEFFKKWSGFLLHVLAFKIGSDYYWTVCSKNYADCKSEYIQYGLELIQDKMKPGVVRLLADKHMYLGGEALHTADQHGYVAKRNALIITCVGDGSFCDLSSRQNSGTPGKFTDYMPLSQIVEFCKTHGLQCDTSYTVSGNALSLAKLAAAIFSERDIMRNADFDTKIVQSSNAVVKLDGNVDHGALVGDVLEGFVLHIQKQNGDRLSKKVKLPFYTWRTFFLRKWLEKIIGVNASHVTGKKFVTQQCLIRINRYVNQWCHTHKELFRNILKCAAVKLQTEWERVIQETPIPDDKIAGRVHIIIADAVENTYFSEGGREAIDQYAARFDAILDGSDQIPILNVCICLGPVGSGKSTMMDRLIRHLPSKYEPIDGDRLFQMEDRLQDIKTTLTMSSERNPVTWSRIYTALMEGKVPVISQGGGVFVKELKDKLRNVCTLKDKLRNVFGMETNLVVVLMQDTTSVTVIKELDRKDLEETICSTYKTAELDAAKDYIAKVGTYRERIGEWGPFKTPAEKTRFYEQMDKRSRGNAAHALAICKTADKIFTAPFSASTQSDEWKMSIVNSTGMGAITASMGRNKPVSGKFNQLRAIVQDVADDIANKHVTLLYEGTTPFEFSAREYQEYASQLETNTYTGKRYMMKLHPAGAIQKEIDTMATEPLEGVPFRKETWQDYFDDTKEFTVTKLTDFPLAGRTYHVTEVASGLPPSNAARVIQYLELGTFGKTFVLDDNYVFTTQLQQAIRYTSTIKSGVPVNQQKVTYLNNFASGDETVRYKCLKVAVFTHSDT